MSWLFESRGIAQAVGLSGAPSAVVHFVPDAAESNASATAVAVGSQVLVYKNMRPYYKFMLPAQPVDSRERTVWQQMQSRSTTASAGQSQLRNLLAAGLTLTPLSRSFVAQPPPQAAALVEQFQEKQLVNTSQITAMHVLYKNVQDPGSPQFLVVATEAKHLLVVATSNFTVVSKCELPR